MNKRSIKIHLAHPWTIRNGMMEAPCTLIREGVHVGSHGPIYWAPHVQKAAAPTWEGIPLTLNHPMVNGTPVSVHHSPEISSRYVIGKVINPYFDEAKKAIKATIQVPTNHPRALKVQRLREVSVGVFSEETKTYGQWNGENYSACAITMQADHLAVLDENHGPGACSWDDSCGIRANSLQILQNALTNYINSIGENTMKNHDYGEYNMCEPQIRFYSQGRKKPEPEKEPTTNQGQDGDDHPEMLLPIGVK